jgi:hypothetical protein
MSTLDEYENRRGPVRKRAYHGRRTKKSHSPGARVNAREVQLALKLMGGTTDKDRGEPFNDDIDFIGRP